MAGRASGSLDLRRAEKAASEAARSVGMLMRRHLAGKKRANEVSQHDIKLELDVRCQKLIERTLRSAFPDVALIGEEGDAGSADADFRWVVDPIDGTVNFAYGIPHACVSIALQGRQESIPGPNRNPSIGYADGYQTLMGVVYDPFCEEMFTARLGNVAKLNGKAIHVSRRTRLNEAVVAIGYAKTEEDLEVNLRSLNQLVRRVRKVRTTGAAALALAYVSCGRFDAYVESGISLWDIAAGGFIIERAGGEFWRRPIREGHKYDMIADNGLLRRSMRLRK